MKKTDQIARYRTAAKLAALTIANALIFQAELAEVRPEVLKLRKLVDKPDLRTQLIEHWKFICETINYVPIFTLAREALEELPERAEVHQSLKRMVENSLRIVEKRAALRHDLMGRVYHKLLLEAKFLGTFYTSVPAATLLLKLALSPDLWDIDWNDLDQLAEFRVADLACGTGTLLMASQQTITDNFIRSRVKSGGSVGRDDLRDLHKVLIQSVIHGYDVLASAVHLTASTLALLAPNIAFQKMNLHKVPLGEEANGEIRLGSVDYLQSDVLQTQFSLMGDTADALTVTGEGGAGTLAPLPDLDLCVMNPPFTRSVGGNLLFGSLPDDQRKRMQKFLQCQLKKVRLGPAGSITAANSTAGLGAVFVAVGAQHIKPAGRIGLVLPEALAFGVAWETTRRLLAFMFDVEYLIVSHDSERWNFSENTQLSEILVIARKKTSFSDSTPDDQQTVCVNLWKNTTTPVDALSLANAIQTCTPADVDLDGPASNAVCSIFSGDEKRGEAVRIPWNSIKGDQWHPLAFAQTDLVRVAHQLRNGVLFVPGIGKTGSITLARLGALGEIGPDRRDVYDGFNIGDSKTIYPAFWGHDAKDVTTIERQPNKYLQPKTVAAKGRHLRGAALLWGRAGRLMVAERMWLATQRLTTVRLDEPALSNVWWPFKLNSENKKHEKALALWLNSTLGIVLLCSYRVPTRGPWVQFKKPGLKLLPVLALSDLHRSTLNVLSHAYDQVCLQRLEPLCNMAADPVRAAIDNALEAALGIRGIDVIRNMLANEPIIANKQLH